MKTNAQFNYILQKLTKLEFGQLREIIDTCEGLLPNITSELEKNIDHCPRCQGERFVKNGTRSGTQRYICKHCGQYFTCLTGTPFEGLHHKNIWCRYIEEMLKGSSLQLCATTCHINIKTAFKWRHRFLGTIKDAIINKLAGIVEFDETYFLESFKGCKKKLKRKSRKRGGKAKKRGISSEQTAVLIARDRNGNTIDAILPQSNQFTIAEVMLPVVGSDSLLCSDTKKSYIAFAKNNDFAHKMINVSKKEHVKDKIYHVQNVNAYDSRLKIWIKRFHGVATKYLDNYLGWMRMLDKFVSLNSEDVIAIIYNGKVVNHPQYGI
jgi:transposase-like protein